MPRKGKRLVPAPKWTKTQVVCTIIFIIIAIAFESMINQGRMNFVILFLPK